MTRKMVAAAAFLICLSMVASSSGTGGTSVNNKFYARFYPRELDPTHEKGFYVMPRTTAEAQADGWAVVPGNRTDQTTLWARHGDYQVCLLFDKQGSVAGIQVSTSKAALKKSGVPLRYDKSAYWFEQTLLGTRVYSAVTYFVTSSVLAGGGRKLSTNTPTAPNLQLQKKVDNGKLSRLPVPPTEAAMQKQSWITQGCYPGQGYHSYQNLTHKTSCMDFTPYFVITSPTNKEVTSFGFSIWGKGVDSTVRPWFETVLSENLKTVVTDKPPCFDQWIDTYGLWSLHIFFEDKPWDVKCV